MAGASVYILRCSDGSLYVGVTPREVEERVSEHTSGLVPGYTCNRRPVELLFSEHYDRVTDAIAAEKRFKGGRAPKRSPTWQGSLLPFKILPEARVRAECVLRLGPSGRLSMMEVG